MSRRLTAIGLVLTLVPLTSARASSGDGGLLNAPPAHARAGVCYAHVRREARYAPPPGPRASWRLSPPPPGAPGPVWCLVVEPSRAPPLLLAAEREGWVRVACAPRSGRGLSDARVPRWPARPPSGTMAEAPLEPRSTPLFVPPVPPPIVRLIPLSPAANYGAPGTRVLTWPGKTAR